VSKWEKDKVEREEIALNGDEGHKNTFGLLTLKMFAKLSQYFFWKGGKE